MKKLRSSLIAATTMPLQDDQKATAKMSELTTKQAQRYHEMFKRLDTNSDGKIDVSDLLELFERIKKRDDEDDLSTLNDEIDVNRAKVRLYTAFSNINSYNAYGVFNLGHYMSNVICFVTTLNLNSFPLLFKTFISKGDTTLSGNLTFIEFVNYMIEHEKVLELVFKGIDTDNNGNSS